MLPAGATFDPAAGRLTWTPGANQSGRHVVRFTADDGVLPVHLDVTIQVEAALNHIGQSPLHADALSWWRPVLFGALAGGMGWGIRGQYGHETGAMIAGLLVSLVLVKICCPHAALLPAARAVAWTTIAIGFSGAMTYGQTIGLTQDPALVGNYAALRWGLLGLAIKGGIWIGFAGVFLGMGLGGVRYRARCGWSCWPCWCCSSPASAW
jgi:hypothetical protein